MDMIAVKAWECLYSEYENADTKEAKEAYRRAIALLTPYDMAQAPKDGTHILAWDSERMPPTVIHFHVDSWYLSRCPVDRNNQFHPIKWMAIR